MEAVILIGIQGSGKSTFCRDRFFNTHVRINLDMLKTRHREKLFLDACLAAKQPFVVDNYQPGPRGPPPLHRTRQGSGVHGHRLLPTVQGR